MAEAFDELSLVNPDELPVSFSNRLDDIYRYDYSEINDFLQNLHKDLSVSDKKKLLENVRIKLFTKLVEISPEMAQAELYNRRKGDLLIYDIYILGNILSGHSDLKDKRLPKIIKLPRNAGYDPTTITVNETDLTMDGTQLMLPQDLFDMCSQMKDLVNTLNNKVSHLSDEIAHLRREVTHNRGHGQIGNQEQDNDVDVANSGIAAATKEDCEKIIQQNDALNRVVTELNRKLNDDIENLSEDEEDDEPVDPQGSLLIGDSLLRNAKSTDDEVKVESLSGAKFCDLKKSLKKINPRKNKLNSLFIVCGTNDISTKKPCERILKECVSALQIAKERAVEVNVSSILPRLDGKVDNKKIDTFNQLLLTTANDLNVNFINQEQNFRYRDNSVDHTLFLQGDGLHLSAQGVQRLLSNLGLHEKVKADFDRPSMTSKSSDPKNDSDNQENIDTWKRPLLTPIPPPPCYTPELNDITPQDNQRQDSGPVLFKGPDNPLSNLYMFPLSLWNMSFGSTEQAYQYRKALEMSQHQTAHEIRTAKTSFDAMDIGRRVKTDERWKNMKVSIMYQLLQEKAAQCQIFRESLSSTSGRTIIENTYHDFWAQGKSRNGLNMLGRLMMTLRDSLPSSRNFSPKPQPHRSLHPMSNFNPRTRPNGQVRCFNCGEKSHTQASCRHQQPIQCYCCKKRGHKQKACPWRQNV